MRRFQVEALHCKAGKAGRSKVEDRRSDFGTLSHQTEFTFGQIIRPEKAMHCGALRCIERSRNELAEVSEAEVWICKTKSLRFSRDFRPVKVAPRGNGLDRTS
jgi:hypothetical protein